MLSISGPVGLDLLSEPQLIVCACGRKVSSFLPVLCWPVDIPADTDDTSTILTSASDSNPHEVVQDAVHLILEYQQVKNCAVLPCAPSSPLIVCHYM